MWSNGQTLRHKETNELVRLVPNNDGSAWQWIDKSKTLFYREDGTVFEDDHRNYTHVEDELGRPVSNPPKEGEFVDTSLKRYIVPEEELAGMREERLKSWEKKVLHSLETEGWCLCPFADGGKSLMFQEYFFKKYNAKPLHLSYNSITNRYDFMYCNQYIMKIFDKFYLYDDQMSELVPTDLNHLKSVVDSLLEG